MVSFWKRKFIWDITMAFLIVILPFGLYIHLFFDTENTVISFYGFQYYHGYYNLGVFLWHILSMLTPILLMLIWYFNYHYWLRYFILIPVLLFEYHLIRHVIKYPVFVRNHILFFSLLLLFFSVFIILIADNVILKRKNKKSIRFNILDMLKSGLKQRTNKLEQKTESIKTSPSKIQVREMFLSKISLNTLTKGWISLNNTNLKSRRKIDYIIIAIFLVLPFLFFLFHFIPEGVQSYGNNWIKIGSYGFPDMYTFIWFINLKLCILIPLFIWFVLSTNWWKFAILSPIIVYTYQLWEALQSTNLADQVSFIKAAPFVLIVLIMLLFISNRVKYQSKILDIHEELTNEIEELFNQLNIEKSNAIKSKYNFRSFGHKNVSKDKTSNRIIALTNMKKELLDQLDKNN